MKPFFWLFFGLLFLIVGCAKPRIVNDPGAGYDSMGYLEERLPVSQGFVKYATLGVLRKHSYRSLTKQLAKKLEKKARKKYGADAVNNIEYWPAVDSDAHIDYLYGRGEMIHYKKFAPSSQSAPTPETPTPAPS